MGGERRSVGQARCVVQTIVALVKVSEAALGQR
jgi:hypothetical protein